MQLQFTVENLEYLLFIAARVSAFVFTAPFFNFTRNVVPQRVKAAFTVYFSVILYLTLPYEQMTSIGIFGFTEEIVKEVFAGALLGFMSSAVMNILGFAGRLIDIEIGFSMVTQMDPQFMVQTSVTGNMYTYAVILMLLSGGFERWIINAFMDTYKAIPVGAVVPGNDIAKVMLVFLADYIIIAVQIALPVYTMILVVNIVLGIMAKIAPQMNMFVVGMQLKVLAGLAVLVFMMELLPGVTNFIINEMTKMLRMVVEVLS